MTRRDKEEAATITHKKYTEGQDKKVPTRAEKLKAEEDLSGGEHRSELCHSGLVKTIVAWIPRRISTAGPVEPRFQHQYEP